MPGVTGAGLIGVAAVILLIGALVGIGCNAGCGYVREHINVEWKK